ncbi:ubiquitin-like-specific protease 1D [Heracleum sosnowskyi]|uniref:Ubiquitin-like-specific protease 1D n=1 Tax=Heracleum sosnowskyi TaxID=360622 RepID=A0AAD8JGM1_9APIA|nr:ubiquitin-like-specific protease 1D [Heracleum sosnowskyi]
MEEDSNKKMKLSLDSKDWSKLLDSNDDDGDPPALMVTKTGADDRPENDDSGESNRFHNESMTDCDLAREIERKKSTYKTMAHKLPDKGRKVLDMIASLEKEKERRERNQFIPKDTRSVKMEDERNERNWRTVKENSGSDMPAHPQSSGIKGKATGVKQVAPPSSRPQSQFGSLFCHKVEEDQADRAPGGAFEKQLKALGRCDRLKTRLNAQVSPKETRLNSQVLPEGTRPNGQVSPKERWSILKSRKSPGFFSGDVKKKYNTSPSSGDMKENLSGYSSRRNPSKVFPSSNSRPTNQVPTIVVLDEECQHVDNIDEEEKADESMKGTKIYFPSRDHPNSVEICYTDMECLAPETYLTSTIMNFYIRYLQQPTFTTENDRCSSYHFFTTYFYEKLKAAVENMKNDMEKKYAKFRRWWKGVNIFEKAYIFLPINENHHWSLVIICIPDKEDECGPILLHLDSLGFHISSSIFEIIKRFLEKEWAYLNDKETSSNYPIADGIWKILPEKIEEKVLMVPQQKNDYDCGLFVLFFIRRFIEDAPQRLRKKDLARFGKQWFSPKEASDLRLEIRVLLKKMFIDSRVIEV